jgi:3-phosphoshikimate 1-carboxyvinyltransferase
MNLQIVHHTRPLSGNCRVPGDKSISHRAVILGSLAKGETRISGFLPSGDVEATVACLEKLGVAIDRYDGASLSVYGNGKYGFRAQNHSHDPNSVITLDCSRSGTTMRLLAGILAPQPFDVVLTGDPQLLRRPMNRLVEPLRQMGAQVIGKDGRAPLLIRGGQLRGAHHTLPVASAQVKSALLLAGLFAEGRTTVCQPGPSRDHTELMLSAMGAPVRQQGLEVSVSRSESLTSLSIEIPGDLSSAAFLMVAAALVPGSGLTIRGVGVNSTRTGLLDAMRLMGAGPRISRIRTHAGEPVGDIAVHASPLHGVEVRGDTIVRMIDELPILAVAATQAHGATVVRDASELRVKEVDRIAALVEGLQTLGGRISPLPDGFIVHGPTPLTGRRVDGHGDHRLAMALTVAGMLASGETTVFGAQCIDDSFPGFAASLRRLGVVVSPASE